LGNAVFGRRLSSFDLVWRRLSAHVFKAGVPLVEDQQSIARTFLLVLARHVPRGRRFDVRLGARLGLRARHLAKKQLLGPLAREEVLVPAACCSSSTPARVVDQGAALELQHARDVVDEGALHSVAWRFENEGDSSFAFLLCVACARGCVVSAERAARA